MSIMVDKELPHLIQPVAHEALSADRQFVRTCPGARGWGEAWAAGALPSSCAEMAAHVVVVCSTCQPRPAAGDGWTMSIMVDKELPHLIQPVAQALSADTALYV
jgi:hypothetical protein